MATHRQCAGRGNAHGVHGLADDVLAQHGPDDGQAVAAPGERGPSRSFEVQVTGTVAGADELAEQQRTAIAQARDIPAELMTGVGLRDGCGAGGDHGAQQQAEAVGAAQPGRGRGRAHRPPAVR